MRANRAPAAAARRNAYSAHAVGREAAQLNARSGRMRPRSLQRMGRMWRYLPARPRNGTEAVELIGRNVTAVSRQTPVRMHDGSLCDYAYSYKVKGM